MWERLLILIAEHVNVNSVLLFDFTALAVLHHREPDVVDVVSIFCYPIFCYKSHRSMVCILTLFLIRRMI